jgi:GNAT superfamily N-acetyltransferase
MKIREVIVESISPAQAWIDQVYSEYPEWPYGQADRVMVWGSGEDQTFAAFKLKPGADARTVEIDWIMAGPEQRQGVGSRAIRELQRQAQESGIRLTLYPWAKGKISQASLTRLYKRHGFKPIAQGAKPMMWEPVSEGGWDTTLTQGTVLHPRVVSTALSVVDQFVEDFNRVLQARGLGPVRRGRPTGSSAYHEQDTVEHPDKVYGDIDLQMIGPETPGQSFAQFTTQWNQLADEFVRGGHAPYVDTSESKPGHPIFNIGGNNYVQIDFMWHPERLEKWGASRVTPERGVKGLLTGNMFSVLGELLDLSIQHAGVQLKVVDGQHVPFSKQKGTEVVTVTTEPATFILDTFRYLANTVGINNPKVSPLLKQNSGNDINNVKISRLVQGVKGFAESCEANGMFGQGALAGFSSARDFLQKFVQRYEEKAQIDIAGKKRDKAATPEAVARAEQDRQKIQQGLDMVKGYFQ